MAGERTLPGLGLTGFWDLGSDGWKPGMDDNLRTLSALVGRGVKSRTTTLPTTGAAGDIYINPVTNQVAIWDGPSGGEGWWNLTPQEGWRLYARDEDTDVVFNGAEWVVPAEGGGSGSVSGPYGPKQSWRIVITGKSSGYATVNEFYFYDVEGNPIDRTGVTATSSPATWGSSPLSNALGGAGNVSWTTVPVTVTFTFPEPTDVAGIGMQCGSGDQVTSYEVQYLDGTWVTAWTVGAAGYGAGNLHTSMSPDIGSGGSSNALDVVEKTADHTLVLADAGRYIRMNSASANAVTIPPNSSVAFPVGTVVHVRQAGAGATSFAAGAGVTLNGTGTSIGTQHRSASAVKVATDTWDLNGVQA